MNMKNRALVVMFAIAAAAASGCTSFERQSSIAGPTAAGNNSMLGSWTSATVVPTPSSCTDFKWNVTEQTATSAKGSFTASCAGDLKLTGTAQGAFTTPVSIAWTAQGNATAPGLTSCAITLSGTAQAGTDSISVPYSGDTCLGKVSGIETLKKR
jgi:hypothetical protein